MLHGYRVNPRSSAAQRRRASRQTVLGALVLTGAQHPMPNVPIIDPKGILGLGAAPTIPLNYNDALLLLAIACAPAPGSMYMQQLSWALAKYIGVWDPLYRLTTPPPQSLRVNPGLADLDPHQKTVLSDDIGVGLSLALLDVSFGVVGIMDCYRAHKAGLLTLTVAGKHRKMPDFIVLLAAPIGGSNIILLECKGSQTNGAQKAQLTSACKQLTNVNTLAGMPAAAFPRVAVAAQLRHGKNAVLHIDDPTEWVVTREDFQELLRANLCAQELSMLGEYNAASSVWADLGLPSWPMRNPVEDDSLAGRAGELTTVIPSADRPIRAKVRWNTDPSPPVRTLLANGRWREARTAFTNITRTGRRAITEDDVGPFDAARTDIQGIGLISTGTRLRLDVQLR